MNCTTETKKVFNVRKEKSINICLWYRSTDRCPTVDPHKKDNQIQPWLTWLLKNRSMVGNPLRVLHEPFSSPAIFINALSKNHKTRLSFQTKHQQLPPPSSHPQFWNGTAHFALWEEINCPWETKLKSMDVQAAVLTSTGRGQHFQRKHLHDSTVYPRCVTF